MRIVVLALFLLCTLIAPISSLQAQLKENKLWQDIRENQITDGGQRYITPLHYRLFRMDLPSLKDYLKDAGYENATTRTAEDKTISLPLADGLEVAFVLVESPVMSDVLSLKYPEIKTYKGVSQTNPAITGRFDITPAGFHAMIFHPEGTLFIDPYNFGNTRDYQVYFKKDFRSAFKKEFNELGVIENPFNINEVEWRGGSSLPVELRTYRLAVATTAEYTNFHGGVSQAMAAIVTTLNRINGIYEKEVAVRMELIDNNDTLIFTNSATDPYSNGNGSAMLNQNQLTIDALIGTENYDIGHVFSTGGGGIAFLRSVCEEGGKARGVTGQPFPVGDPFDVDYVAHEIGHQFGGQHTFAHCFFGGGGGGSDFEPGSGSTIMAYAGICSADDNIQFNSDDYFHIANLNQITSFIQTGDGNSCPVRTPANNNSPTAEVTDLLYWLPINTPFKLTGTGSDPDGDLLTYCWEQYDQGPSSIPNNPVGNAPLFRSFSPVEVPYRIFPRISDIVNGTQTLGEILPSYGRNMKFRMTTRDNNPNGGGFDFDEITLQVEATAGPFEVISPTDTITWEVGNWYFVDWDVAGTDLPPVNCSEVNILLSTDGGYTYTDTLIQNAPNDGSEAVFVPDVPTNQARVMVECSNNVFFNISPLDFVIENSGNVTGLEELEDLIDLVVFPNPANDQLSLMLPKDLSLNDLRIEILDIQGKVVLDENLNFSSGTTSYTVDIQSLITGMHLLRIMKGTRSIASNKFIKL